MKKTALITGASRGAGFSVASALCEAGYNTVLCARRRNERTDAFVDSHRDSALFATADIASASDREKLLEAAVSRFGRLDILVNNAGTAPRVRKDMLEITQEDFDYVMNVNLKGTYFLTQAASRLIMKNGGGYIIFVGSISSDAVSFNRAEYCISKAGIHMLARLFAARLAENNIGAFEISPGVIDTDMISSVREKYKRMADEGKIPARRLGVPEDVAKLVLAIASGALDYSTGTTIHCDGGLHIPVL